VSLCEPHVPLLRTRRSRRVVWTEAEALVRPGRQSLLQGSDTLARASNRLEQGHRSLVETEELGNDVLASLQRQRQQMKNTQCVACCR
jgi:hypothetical protein